MISFLPLPSNKPRASATRPPPTPNARLRPALLVTPRPKPVTRGARNPNPDWFIPMPCPILGSISICLRGICDVCDTLLRDAALSTPALVGAVDTSGLSISTAPVTAPPIDLPAAMPVGLPPVNKPPRKPPAVSPIDEPPVRDRFIRDKTLTILKLHYF